MASAERSGLVHIHRAPNSVLPAVRERYGEADDALERALERIVISAEGRAKRCETLPAATEATAQLFSHALRLLQDITDYAALGEMGGADQSVCDALQPLLTRLAKTALSGGFAQMVPDEEEDNGDDDKDDDQVEALLDSTARALSNCGPGVTRRAADCEMELRWDLRHCSCHGCAIEPHVKVTFGFADFASSETGAMLWAGAIGLTLYLVEHWHALIKPQPLRVLELGCGPALVSLAAAHMFEAHAAAAAGGSPSCAVRWSISDIAPDVVSEVAKSLTERNTLPHVRCGRDSSGQQAAAVVMEPLVLDFMNIPSSLHGCYDLILGSDIVYDYTIAAQVAPAVERLLRPGGKAVLCCEAHRDGMQRFVKDVRDHVTCSDALVVEQEVHDVQDVLSAFNLPPGISASVCSLVILRKMGTTGATN